MRDSPKFLKILLIAAVSAAGSAVACAADLPVRVYTKAAPAAAVFDWTGGYVGVNVGVAVGGEGRSGLDILANGGAFETFNLASAGVVAGGQAGYNYQFGDWVVGAEADIQGIGNETHRNCILLCTAGSSASLSQDMPWFGTVRGRVGYATGPILNYVTGGFAYGGVRTSDNEIIPGGAGSVAFNRTKTGFALGSGIEAAIGDRWTAKIEYLYLDLGSNADTFTIAGGTHVLKTEARESVFRAGANYRFGAPGGPYAATPAINWRGFYAGGNGGSGIARDETSHSVVVGPTLNNNFDLAPRGFNGGLQAGYNWQNGNWLYGLESDFQGSTQVTDRSCLESCSATGVALFRQKLEWFGTLRGRVGYGVGPTLFYGTGGLAYGGVRTRVTENIPIFGINGTATVNNVRAGYAAGAGIETPLEVFDWFAPDRWTVKTEYLYIDLGNSSSTYALNGVPHALTTNEQNHIFRTGVNYRFDTPIAAKY
jgi:outer membrane immunogenic protein